MQKEKPVVIPDEILLKYLSKQELDEFKENKTGIFSVTVYAEKAKCMCNC